MPPGWSIAVRESPVPFWVPGPWLLESSRDAVWDRCGRSKTQF